MSTLITSNEPGYFMQQDFPSQSPSEGLQPSGGAIGLPSFQNNSTNVPSHKPNLLHSYLLNIVTNGRTPPTSRSCFSNVLSSPEGTVAGIQHDSLNQLTKVDGTSLNNEEFSISSNDHIFQSLQKTGNIPHEVPADLQPMEMSMYSQQSESVQNIMNQTVFGTVATSQSSNSQLQRQPFIHCITPDTHNLRTTESDSPLQIQQNRSMSLPYQQRVQNCQARQQCPAHIQRQHQIQDLMSQTLSADFLAQLRHPVQEGFAPTGPRPVQAQQQVRLCQPRLPRWSMQHHPSTQPLRLPGQFQQVQPSQPVQQFQNPGQLHHPEQINQSGQFLSRLQLDQHSQQKKSSLFHQLQAQNHPLLSDHPGQVQQPVPLQTPVEKTQNLQLMVPSMTGSYCVITPSTLYITPKITFTSVNAGNADAAFNESLTQANGMLRFSNNKDFVRPYQLVAVMGNEQVNTQQVGVTSTNLSMHSPNVSAGIATPTSNTVCSIVEKIDSFQVPKNQFINSAAYLSGSENNLVTVEDLAKINSEIIKSQQNTLNLQRTYESQKRALYSTNSCTKSQLSSAEGSLISLNNLDGEQVAPYMSTNPQSIDQSLEKIQSVQRISAELARFASQYDLCMKSSQSKQTINLPVGSKPENSSTSFIPSQEHVNISRTPADYNQMTNQYLPASHMSSSATSLQHNVMDGEPIAISNGQITYGTERLITRTINHSLQLPNAVNSISMQKSNANLYSTIKQQCSAIAKGANYLNPPSSAENASICKNIANLTDAQMSTPSADHIIEEVFYPCPAKQSSSTSSADGTMKQHSSTNSDRVICDTSRVDFLKKEIQMGETNGSVISGGEVERPAVTAARYTNDIVSFNLIKAIEPQVAIVNPLRVLKGKSPSVDEDTELPKIEASQGNHFVVEDTDEGIGDAASANHDERGIETLSPLSNKCTLFDALDHHTPTVSESSKVGDVTNDYSCRDVDESIINQFVHFVEETKLSINGRICDSTGPENSDQPYAPQCQDSKLGGASGTALDDSNLLISSFCTLVEGSAFYDPQIAEIVDAITPVQSMASKDSYARNDKLQTVGELELAPVNYASTQETALTGLKYPKHYKIGSSLDQEISNRNEQGIEENVSPAIANLSKPNFKDFATLTEPSTPAKQALDISNKENEPAAVENIVNKNSNFHYVITDNSTVCESNKPEEQVPGTSVDSHVEKLHYEDSTCMERGTKDYEDMAGVKGNMNFSSNNPSPNTEVKNSGQKVNYYSVDTGFETDQTREDCESVNGMLSAPSPNDQLSELLREYPYGLDTIGRKASFEHSVLDMDIQPNYLIPLNEFASKSELSNDKMLLQVEGEGSENQQCENWQTLKRDLNYGKLATSEDFCISSSNTENAEYGNLINENQLLTMDTEHTHLLASDTLLLSSINMECNQNPNLFKPESTNAKNVSIVHSENECVPSEGMETDYQTSDNLKPCFPDSLASVFTNREQILPPPILDGSITGPPIGEYTVCEMDIGTSEYSPEDSTIVLKRNFLSIPEDNDTKHRNTVAQVNDVKRIKLDCIKDPLNPEQKIMEGKLFPKTTSQKKIVKPKYEKESIHNERIPCEINNSVPGHTKLKIKFKDAKFKADQQNVATPVTCRRIPELDRPFPPLETLEDPDNVGHLDRKAQNVPRLVVKMDFFKSSKAFGGIRKRTIIRDGVNRLKTKQKKIKKATLIARAKKGAFSSNHSCEMNKSITFNGDSNCKVPALKISLEKQSAPYEKVFNEEKTCIVEESDSALVLDPDISELHSPKYHCSKYHQANFEQYKKRIQIIQEYRQHQKEQAKELEEIAYEPNNKSHQSTGKTQIQVNKRKEGTNSGTKSVTQSCKDITTVKNNASEPKTSHEAEEKIKIHVHEGEESSSKSNAVCLGGNTHTSINYSKPVAHEEDVIILEDDVPKPNQPREKNQIKTPESGIDKNGICSDESMNLNSSKNVSKSGSDVGIVTKEAVTCQKDYFSSKVSKQPSAHILNRTAFRNQTCENICLMILGSSSASTISSTEILPQRKCKPILPKEPSLAVPQSQPEIKTMAESTVFGGCHLPNEVSISLAE